MESEVMKMYLCCNQIEHHWEVRQRGTNEIIFKGTLNECEEYVNENK